MPPIDAREDYTKRKYARTPEGYTAEMGWTVAWAPDATSAEEAVGVKVNDKFLFGQALLCNYVRCEKYNFNLSEVRATFLQSSSNLEDLSVPLNNPPRIRWRICQRSIMVDRDMYSNAITNSAGDPFRNPAHLEDPILAFTIYRIEPTFNPQLTVDFTNAYNSDVFAPLGIPAILPGQCRCTSILPTEEYTYSGLTWLRIAYEFEVLQGFQQDPDKVWDPWRYRVLDVGSMGWFVDPADGKTKRGVFCDGLGRQLAVDVRLDGTGKPVDPTVQVADPGDGTRFDPVSNPSWSKAPPQNVIVDHGTIANDPNTWITYDVRKQQKFQSLGF